MMAGAGWLSHGIGTNPERVQGLLHRPTVQDAGVALTNEVAFWGD